LAAQLGALVCLRVEVAQTSSEQSNNSSAQAQASGQTVTATRDNIHKP